MTDTNSAKPLSGVRCVVNSCVHHSEDNKCLAGTITVGGRSACAKSETDCETFSKCESCS